VNEKRERMCFVQNYNAKAAGLSFSRPSNALFYDAASELGVDQSAFGIIDSLAQRRVIEVLSSGEARKRFISEYPHSAASTAQATTLETYNT